jgi:hypothetical protein
MKQLIKAVGKILKRRHSAHTQVLRSVNISSLLATLRNLQRNPHESLQTNELLERSGLSGRVNGEDLYRYLADRAHKAFELRNMLHQVPNTK